MPDAQPNDSERRQNVGLRELLDEMIELVRRVSREAPTLGPGELEYAQQRIEWLADEIWEEIATKAREKG